MWLNRMLEDRQEILVLGELVLFLAAWGLGIAAAVEDYRVRTNANAGNNVAANSIYSVGDFSEPGFSGPGFSGRGFSEQRGEFE